MAAYSGPLSADIGPNPDHITLFLEWWFKHVTKGVIEIGWMDPAAGGLTHFRQFEPTDIDALVIDVCAINAVPGQAVYVRASTVQPRSSGFSTDADFVQAPGIWGDLDTAEQVERAKAIQTLVRPNGSVITGRSPHLRCQTFFRTDVPITDPALVRALNKGLHALYGGDSSVINPSRLMRLPGTIAWPWKPGRVVELTHFALPTDNRPSSYSVAMLTTQLPQEAGPQERPEAQPTGRRATLNTAAEYIRCIQSGVQWHDNMIRLVAHWIGRGWSNAEILTAAESFTLPGYTHAQTRADVMKATEGARSKWNVPDPVHTVTDAQASPFSDKVVDPWEDLTPPAFPHHAVPVTLQRFVESRARVMGADPCALAWTAISACSAAISGSVRLQMKRHDSWSVPPSIWVALIGKSSTKKTPIIQSAWGHLEKLQAGDLANWARQHAIWKAMDKKERDATQEPPHPLRTVSHDLTMESMQELLGRQSRGVGVLKDELAGFIGSMDKYNSGKGGAADRAFFLQAYNGGPFVVDRIGRGTTAIENLLATICGGIQPDRLAQFSDLTDDGLFQRFVPIILGLSDMGSDEPAGPEVEQYERMVEGLLTVDGRTRASFADAAHEVREEFEREIFALERRDPLGPRFSSFIGKLPGLFGRLSLVLSHIEPGAFPFIVSEKTAQAARTLILRSVIPHAAQVYTVMGGDGASVETTRGIAGYILTKKLTRLLASDLTRNVRVCRLATVQQIQSMVSRLVASGWLVPEKEHGGNNSWAVNPCVHVIFADHAARESLRRMEARAMLFNDDGDE